MAILTVSAVVAGIGGTLQNIASGAITIIKVVASIAFAVIFSGAIVALVGMLEAVVFGSIVGEVFGILSVCLPFNPGVVFGALNLTCIGILAFLVARKVYLLTSNLISVSGGNA